MTRTEILEKATEIFRDVFDDDSIVLTEETTAADIEDWDSLMHITLINEIEEAFGYKFGMKEVLGMKNVGEMCDILEKNT
ncbi:MAG: acyl carrier protein [Lachnospiraceae bacterium]|nr:acyl carrier protein [Lachnospiraceae bacterium]